MSTEPPAPNRPNRPNRPDDPLDALRRAWDRIDAPEVPGGDRLIDEDAATRASVTWARNAWASTPIPVLAAPRRRRRGRVLRMVVAPAAAAAVLLVTFSGLLSIDVFSGPNPGAGPSSSDVALATSEELTPTPAGDPATTVPSASAVARMGAAHPDPLVALLGSEACVCSPADPFRTPLPVLQVVQRSALLESAIRANRNGSWSDAAQKAQLVLDREEATPEDRLGALCQLALSFQALGQRDESTAYLSQLEDEISGLRAR